MRRVRISPDLSLFPEEFRPLVEGAAVYDSSCSPFATVYFIDREGGFYLKTAEKGSLQREALMDDYFAKKGLGAKVLSYRSSDRDWLLTERVAGEDCCDPMYLASPERLCDLLATRLRMLHETDASDCPVPCRMEEYFATAEANYRKGQYDLSYGRGFGDFSTPEEARKVLEQGRGLMKNEVLLHGDYCLPNVLLRDWTFSGFIDLDGSGVGDRHVDLFWGAWTLNFNLKTDRYRQRFFDAYGRDRVEEDLLSFVGAAEAFG
jgi:kanamycin kinase